MSSVAGAQAIFDAFGLEEVSTATRIEMEQWHATALVDARWSIPAQGCMLGAVCPEFQVQ